MCVKQLVDFISSKCDSDKQRSEFAQLLRDPAHHVGWLVNERFLNIPMEIAPPLLVSLSSEVRSAKKKGWPFSIDYYLILTRSHLLPKPTNQLTGKKRKKKGSSSSEVGGASSRVGGASDGELLFDFQENEILKQDSVLTFSFPVDQDADDVMSGGWSFEDVAMTPMRTVMVIPANNLHQAINKLQST